MKTIGLGIITRNCEYEILDKALNSVASHVDAVYITVADKEPPADEIIKVVEKYGANLSYFKWVNNFAKARNFNMSQCKEDWYTWMDTDDTIEGAENFRSAVNGFASNIAFGLATYNYAFYPSGMVATKHPKERFIRNDGTFTWKGYLHENCVPESQLDGTHVDSIIWNHHTDDARSMESAKRNIKIIEQEITDQLEVGKPDPRTVFNLGMAYASIAQRTMAKEDWLQAIRAFHKYLEVGGWDEHAYMAWKFIGFGQQSIDRPEQALDSYFEALKICPQYSDAYAAIGSAYDRLNHLDKAEIWYKLALTEGKDNAYAHDVGMATLTPLTSLARIYALKGKIDEAEKYAKTALEITGSDPQIEGILEEIQSIREKTKFADGVVAKLKKMSKEEAQEYWSSLGEIEKAYPSIVNWRRGQDWGMKSSGKDIVIFTGQSWEEWNPDSAKTGIGGSEEAVINMAKEFKNQGWNVSVYGTHGPEPKEYDGVWYRPWWSLSIKEACDIFIAWRDPGIFELEINSPKKYLWLHDTNDPASLTERRVKNITKIITLSEWHRNLYPLIPDSKMLVSRNGILPKHFEEVKEKEPAKIAYTSAPNRGLHCLLEMWPKIREKIPNAELHWAYGWETYDKAAASNPQMQVFKKRVVGLLNQPGVKVHGRIGHEELADLMKTSNIWAYPTEFTEISCITAMKMQAAGTVPVCTTTAALNETVQYGHKFDVPDMWSNKEAQEKFIDALVDVVENGYEKRDEMREWAIKHYGWDTVAKEWLNEFQS